MIQTAEEFLKSSETYDEEYSNISLWDCQQAMIEFAKLHVQEALKEASEKGDLKIESNWGTYEDRLSELNTNPQYSLEQVVREIYCLLNLSDTAIEVDKESILNSYNLDNIK